jgi:hypothetical protein
MAIREKPTAALHAINSASRDTHFSSATGRNIAAQPTDVGEGPAGMARGTNLISQKGTSGQRFKINFQYPHLPSVECE